MVPVNRFAPIQFTAFWVILYKRTNKVMNQQTQSHIPVHCHVKSYERWCTHSVSRIISTTQNNTVDWPTVTALMHMQCIICTTYWLIFFKIKQHWGTGIRGLMRGTTTLPQGNQELLVVRDKVGRPPGELGVSKSMEYDIFPSVLWHCWLGDTKGIRPVKNWMLVCWWCQHPMLVPWLLLVIL